MAKLKAGRLRREVADGCLQYWGGMGFMNETPVSRGVSRWTAGLDRRRRRRIMLTIICKLMGTLPGTSNAPEQRADHG